MTSHSISCTDGVSADIFFFSRAAVNDHKESEQIHRQQREARRSFRVKNVVCDSEDEVLC